MKSHVTAQFRRQFAALPAEVRQRGRRSYLLWRENPAHPGVQFKRVHPHQPIYSARIGLGWRAVGLRQGDTVIYDSLLKGL